MMHGYNNFAHDVKEKCKMLMQKYGLKVIRESNLEVIFKSPYCILSFATEYDRAEFFFKQKDDAPWMFFGPYLHAQFPDAEVIIPPTPENLSRIDKIRFEMDINIELINTYCTPILEGDFSWEDRYNIK